MKLNRIVQNLYSSYLASENFYKNNQVSSKSLQPNLSKISQGYVYLLSTRHTSYVTPFAKKPNISYIHVAIQ